MNTKLYDLAVVTGSYTDRNGETKRNYENVGAIMQSDKDDRRYIILKATFNPAAITRKEGSNYIFINMYKPRDLSAGQAGKNDESRNQSTKQNQQRQNDNYSNWDFTDTDEVPF